MIEHEFELNILIKEETTERTLATKSTLDFCDIMYYYRTTYETFEVTAMKMVDGDVILVDLKYDAFKEKYNKRKAEILESQGTRH